LRLYEEHCEDVNDSPGQEHTFSLDRIERFYDPIGGNSKSTGLDTTYSIYDGKWMYEFQQSSAAAHLSVPGLPSNNTAAIKCLAESNPSKPTTDIPLFVYELREIPSMLKYYARFWKKHLQAGRNGSVPEDLLEVGNILLSYQFGIKPLIGDIQNILAFQTAIEKRRKDLEALNSKKGVHARVKAGSGVVNSQTTPVLNTEGGILISGIVGKITKAQVWATTRWTADPAHPLPSTDEGMQALAIKAAYGLDINVDTLYNAMPWTWLADWFGDLGDYVSTFRNTVPAIHSKVCVMRTTKTEEYGQRTGSAGPFMTGGQSFSTHRTTLSRAVMPFVLPEAHMPILDARKWSILGALGLQRIPRGTTNRVIALSEL
jgi:hypothetical protein